MKNPKEKLFALYSLENSVYYGAKQYLQIGKESPFFSAMPEFMHNISVFETNNANLSDILQNENYSKEKNTFISLLYVTDLISRNLLVGVLINISKNVGKYSTLVMNFDTKKYEDETIKRILFKADFLIYEEKSFQEENRKIILAEKNIFRGDLR